MNCFKKHALLLFVAFATTFQIAGAEGDVTIRRNTAHSASGSALARGRPPRRLEDALKRKRRERGVITR